MTRVLLTGMTAPQASKTLNEKTVSFAGVLAQILESAGIDVVWETPSITSTKKDFDQYDTVIVGLAPVLSLTANRAYTALATIDTLKSTKKLITFIDAPEPSKIHASLRAVRRDGASLIKPLYSKRLDYKTVVQNEKHRKRISATAVSLANNNWVKTIYPVLPWDFGEISTAGFPENAAKSCVGVNVDSFLLGQQSDVRVREQRWIFDTPTSKWTKVTANHLTLPGDSAKTKRSDTDLHIVDKIAKSTGILIGPHDDKLLWWSPRFAQSMNVMTPIATEWRLSSKIGSAWSYLASGIEEMSDEDRRELAHAQYQQYANAAPSRSETVKTIVKEIGI
jgi:hypothetical protein